MVVLAAFALMGSGGCTEAPPAAINTNSTSNHWILTVMSQPEMFSETVEVNREGWIALHNRDPERALSLFESKDSPKALQLRALWDVAVLYEDLARLEMLVNIKLFESWIAQASLNETDPVHVIAKLAESCDDMAGLEQAASWSQYPVLQERIAEHNAVLNQTTAPSNLLAAAPIPVIKTKGDGIERTLYDPCVYNTLSRYWVERAKAAADTNDWRDIPTDFTSDDIALDGVLFGLWASTEDLLETSKIAKSMGTLGAYSQTLKTLGFSSIEEPATGRESAKEDARQIAKAGDDLRNSFANTVPESGKSLETELRLIDDLELKLLLSRTRLAIEADKKGAAYSYALATAEPSSSTQDLQQQNRLVLLANASIINGREREAMDAIHKLVRNRPDITGLAEVLSDLVVLRNINRTGESKEN